MSQAGRKAVYGASGSGKTTLMRSLIAKEPRLVLFALDRKDPAWKGLNLRYVDKVSGIKDAISRGMKAGRWRVCYIPPADWELEALHGVSRLLRDIQDRTAARWPVTFAVDELQISFPNEKISRALMGFGELCSRGRARRIEMIAAAQRVAEVNTRWRGNESERYIFRQGDENDFNQAARWLPNHKVTLRNLQNYEYLHVNAAAGKITHHKPRSK